MFDNSLKGPALTWYYRLKPRSIDFEDLSKRFQRQFSLNMNERKYPSHFFFVVQHMDETLRFYTQCFNKEMLEVTDCHDSVVVQAFRKCLINGISFYDSLTIRIPTKIVDVLHRAFEFVKLENDQRICGE